MNTLYVPRTKQEFERITALLCELGISWTNKSGWGWNIQVNYDIAAVSQVENKNVR